MDTGHKAQGTRLRAQGTRRRRAAAVGAVVVAIVVLTACAGAAGTPTGGAATATRNVRPTLEDPWLELHQQTPYPFSSPLPPAEHSALDGTYAKVDPKEGTPVPCRRCPDYAPEGGVWQLSLDDGIFRIYHPGTGWKSLGSFVIDGDEIRLFNDPTCLDVTGRYQWRLAEGALTLTVVDDPCAIDLRAANLTKQPWLSCRPPNEEAGVTGHWLPPEGCGG